LPLNKIGETIAQELVIRPTERPIKVTIIDDDGDDYFIICNLLRGIGGNAYVTEWVSRYAGAVVAIMEQKSDVYLIDFRLGEKTGLEILKEIRGSELSRPMILLTGLSDRAIDIECMEVGASDFLKKAHLTSELLERSIRYSIRRSSDLIQLKTSERIKVQKDAAEAANVAKSRFLANMSHELRTPLTAVLGFTELAKNPNVSWEERLDFLNTISKSGEHLLNVINSILDISKIEDGHLQIDSTPFLVQENLRDIFSIMDSAAKAKGLTFTLIMPETSLRLTGLDAHRFRQMLFNMIGNAIKFTKSGAVTVELRLEDDKNSYVVSVKDTGIGINECDQSNLFKPYSQANSKLSKQFGGTGLGLDLSRRLARALGGELELSDTSALHGSTFSLTLPSAIDLVSTANVIAKRGGKNIEDDLPFNELQVLLAEDSKDNQRLIGHYLKGSGIVLSFASNGREALELALTSHFDVILMDIQMPEMDGYEVTETLRKQGYVSPIIALTAYAFNEEREKALNSGFTDFVSKPIHRGRLLAALRKAEKVVQKKASVR
jgi:signal transduction histidine kinase